MRYPVLHVPDDAARGALVGQLYDMGFKLLGWVDRDREGSVLAGSKPTEGAYLFLVRSHSAACIRACTFNQCPYDHEAVTCMGYPVACFYSANSTRHFLAVARRFLREPH